MTFKVRHFFAGTMLTALSALQAYAVSPSATPISGPFECGTSIYGAWVTHEGETVVNIKDCGNNGICGNVLKFPDNAKYSELMPETAMPLLGESGPRILSEFYAKSENKFKGRIFNPRNGKDYKSTLKVSKVGDLKVKGCLGPICETKIWIRPKSCR